MDRPVDFYRARRMGHDQCGYTGIIDLEWYERYREGAHGCPGCGAEGEMDDSLQFMADLADPVLDDSLATAVTWFHTSTRPDWPAPVDFSTVLTDETRRMMGEESAARWVAGQSSKALHVGTYESAVHNMLRRMSDQSDKGKQFYLYGVRLRSDVVIQPGSTIDPSRKFGDVWIDEIAAPEIDFVRYVNVYEDPGGISAAIRPSAIAATQQLPIPLAPGNDDPWIVDTSARLRLASAELPPLPAELSRFPYLHRDSPRAKEASEVTDALAAGLPASMEHQFRSAVRWEVEDDPAEWVRYAKAIAALVEDAARVLSELAAQPTREL